ncbi:MAG TPA: hypothetical protein PKE07_15420 [Lacibacter sp.]|nr:hypothetical protein [Lacibacter sp.]HMO90545.1 hypothetical protein [Lacibacter sp.]
METPYPYKKFTDSEMKEMDEKFRRLNSLIAKTQKKLSEGPGLGYLEVIDLINEVNIYRKKAHQLNSLQRKSRAVL